MNKSILIVEDDVGIANSLKLYLGNSGFDINILESGERAVETILSGDYGIVILDLNLPTKDGIQICREVRTSSNIPIIMLTARSGDLDRVVGLEIGADDYVSKPFSPRELLARINTVLRRVNQSQTSNKDENNILEFEGIKIDKNKALVCLDGVEIEFTKNEFDILVKIIEEDGNIVSREVLMKDIMGYENYLYDRTIDTHIKNIRKKLDSKEVILTVRGVGYRLNK